MVTKIFEEVNLWLILDIPHLKPCKTLKKYGPVVGFRDLRIGKVVNQIRNGFGSGRLRRIMLTYIQSPRWRKIFSIMNSSSMKLMMCICPPAFRAGKRVHLIDFLDQPGPVPNQGTAYLILTRETRNPGTFHQILVFLSKNQDVRY